MNPNKIEITVTKGNLTFEYKWEAHTLAQTHDDLMREVDKAFTQLVTVLNAAKYGKNVVEAIENGNSTRSGN